MSRWWDDDVRIAYSPAAGENAIIDMGTMPEQLRIIGQLENLAGDPQQVQQVQPKKKQGGFFNWVSENIVDPTKSFTGGAFGAVGGVTWKPVDSWLGNWSGWDETKGVVKDVTITPLESVASMWRWAYSEAFSQPLSTLLLQFGKFGAGDLNAPISPMDWKHSYKTANSMSPGQVAANMNIMFGEKKGFGSKIDQFISAIPVVNLISAPAKAVAFGVTGRDVEEYNPELVRKIEERGGRAEDLLTATELMRGEHGSYYTFMSGSTDFAMNFIGDPVKIITKPIKAIKGHRANTLGMDGMTEPQVITSFGNPIISIGGRSVATTRTPTVNPWAIEQGHALPGRLSAPVAVGSQRSALDIVNANIDSFRAWAVGKSTPEILQHPMYARMRNQPGAYQMADIIRTSVADNGDISTLSTAMLYLTGDVGAYQRLAIEDFEVASKLAKYQDHRTLVAGETKLMEQAVRRSQNQLTRKVNRAVLPWSFATAAQRRGFEAKYGPGARTAMPSTELGPVPTTAFPAEEAAIQAAREGQPVPGAVEGVPGGYTQATRRYDAALTFKQLEVQEQAARVNFLRDVVENNNARLAILEDEISSLVRKSQYYRQVFGEQSGRALEDKVASATLFGNLERLPLSERASRMADVRIKFMTTDRVARQTTGGIAMRTIQRGILGPAIRVVTSFGDRAPKGMINLNLVEDNAKVVDMLKRVPGLGSERRLELIRTYSAASDKATRMTALQDVQREVIRHMMTRKGMSEADADELWKLYEEQKLATLGGLSTRSEELFTKGGPEAFSGAVKRIGVRQGPDGEAIPVYRRVDMMDEGEGVIVTPLLKTQLQYTTPLLDVKLLGKIIDRNASQLATLRRGTGSAADFSKALAETFNGLWKPLTLLRPGYIPRMISDEVLAKGAKFGALSIFMDAGRGSVNFMRNRMGNTQNAVDRMNIELSEAVQRNFNAQYAIALRESEAARHALNEHLQSTGGLRQSRARDADAAYLQDEYDRLEEITDMWSRNVEEINAYIDARKVAIEGRTPRRLGTGVRTVEGQRVPEPFSEEWAFPIAREEVSSHDFYQKLMARTESMIREDFVRTGRYVTITPDEPGYMQAWLRALNYQVRQDPVANALLRDPTGNEAWRFLKSAEGRVHRQSLGRAGRDPDELVENIAVMIDQYVPENLRMQLAERPLKEKELLDSNFDLPTVHGEEIAAHLGKESVMSKVDGFLDNTYKKVASIPADIASRHPTYVRLHNGHMDTLVKREVALRAKITGDPNVGQIPMSQLNEMMRKAHTLAMGDMRKLLFDTENVSNATMALRNLAPFVGAHLDSIRRWTGLIGEKPELVGTVAKIYNGPAAAGMVTDGMGHKVDQDGFVEYVDTDGSKVRRQVPQRERQVVLQIPKPLHKFFPTVSGEVMLPMTSLNTVLPGDPWWNPGAGPLVAIPVNEYLRENPTDSDIARWLSPFGPPREETLLGRMAMQTVPAWIRNLRTAFDPDGERFAATVHDQLLWELVRFQNGERDTAPTFKEVQAKAKNYWMIKAMASFMYPVAMGEDNPMRFYTDQYLKMTQLDPAGGEIAFMQKYGEDAFILASTLTKNNTGIKATLNAVRKSKELQDLIERFPEYGGLLVGPEGDGPFSRSAYNYQLTHQISAGDTRKQREIMSPEESIKQGAIKAGWAKFRYVMNAIDSVMIDRGMTSLVGEGAADLLMAKKQLIASIAEDNPYWYEDFSTFDKSAIPRRIEDFKKLVAIRELRDNPLRSDIRTLETYLILRDEFQRELIRRKAAGGSLSLASTGRGRGDIGNSDLAIRWNQAVSMLKERDTMFADLYNRYLQNDVLQFGADVY